MLDFAPVDASRDIEEAIIGSVLLGGSTNGIDLKGDDFYVERYQWAWHIFKDLETKGQQIDIVTVGDALNSRLQEFGGSAELVRLMGVIPHSANIGTYAVRLREYSTKRKIQRFAEGLVDQINNHELPLEDILKTAEDRIKYIKGEAIPQEKLEDALDVAVRWVELLHNEKRCIPTGIPKIDLALGGLERQTQLVLAGRPGLGKTALAMQIARNLAAAKYKVIFFSLEMSSIGLWTRVGCGTAGVMWRDVLGHRSTPDQIALAEKTGIDIGKLLGPYMWIDEKKRDIDSIWRLCGQYRPDAIFVDHVRLVKEPGENEVKRLGKITEELHDMAKEYDMCAVTLCQLNRALEYRDNKAPDLQDLRSSGEIEENADDVLMLHWPHKDNLTYKIPIDLWVRKHRNGPSQAQLKFEFDVLHQWMDYGKDDQVVEFVSQEPPDSGYTDV